MLNTAIDNEIDLKNLTNSRNNNAVFKPGSNGSCVTVGSVIYKITDKGRGTMLKLRDQFILDIFGLNTIIILEYIGFLCRYECIG